MIFYCLSIKPNFLCVTSKAPPSWVPCTPTEACPTTSLEPQIQSGLTCEFPSCQMSSQGLFSLHSSRPSLYSRQSSSDLITYLFKPELTY